MWVPYLAREKTEGVAKHGYSWGRGWWELNWTNPDREGGLTRLLSSSQMGTDLRVSDRYGSCLVTYLWRHSPPLVSPSLSLPFLTPLLPSLPTVISPQVRISSTSLSSLPFHLQLSQRIPTTFFTGTWTIEFIVSKWQRVKTPGPEVFVPWPFRCEGGLRSLLGRNGRGQKPPRTVRDRIPTY